MHPTVRLFIYGGVLILAGYVLATTQPEWMAQVGTDLLRVPTYRAELREELEFGRRLDEIGAALMASEELKQLILQDLIHKRLTLVETAERFRGLDRVRLHGQPNRFCRVWPGSSEIERYCRQIIHAVHWELYERPSTAAAVLGRLNREFQAAVESGTFCLLR
jgi:hypothetical protein